MTGNVYRLLLLLHIASIVVAFAPVSIHPVLCKQTRADNETAMLQRLTGYMAKNGRRIHGPALGLAGLFGIGLVLASDDAWKFDQSWVNIALVLWIAMNGVIHGIIIPGEKRESQGDLAAAQRVDMGGALTTLLFIAMMYVMIWKPGL